MATLVKVRKWGNSLCLVLPRSFALKRGIVDGTTVQIDQIRVLDGRSARPRRRYKLKNLLTGYQRPPKSLGFSQMGWEIA